jgi:hypothetical protein
MSFSVLNDGRDVAVHNKLKKNMKNQKTIQTGPSTETSATYKPAKSLLPKPNLPQGANPPPKVDYCQRQLSGFMPVRVPEDWTQEKDIAEFVEIWGEQDDYRQATFDLLEGNLDQLNSVLENGIMFLAGKQGFFPRRSPSTMSVREKIALFTNLLPKSAGENYILRFSVSLARVLWLEAERERIGRYPDSHQWLFLIYQLAERLLGVALDLEEALRCEHWDFDASTLREVDRCDR